MFGKVASISFVLAITALGSASHANVDTTTGNDGFLPLSPVEHRNLNIPQPQHQQNADIPPRINDTPTAPLPPAVWPGMVFLLSLGGVRVVMNARKRLLQG